MDTTTKPVQGTQTNTEETETPALAAEEACPAGGEVALEAVGRAAVLKKKLPKFFAFFAKYWGLFAAPLIAFVLYMVQLAISQVYPFGPDYTVASYDLSAQICPFIEHLFDVLDGKSSLFYSYSIAGGADVFGTFAYFFISPFSFIFLLFGDGNVYNACGIVMAFKLATTAFAGAWFVKKLFKNIPDYVGVAIGVVYAYCGYTFVANTYINWVDFLIYMPFCAAAFVYFTRTKKFLPFSILTACAQIAAGVVDQAVLNEIEAVLPLIRNGIDGDLLVIELTGFFILHLVRLAGEHHVPVFDGDVAHKELFIRACAFVVRLDDLSEKIVGLAVIPLRLLHRVHQIGEIALAVDRAHIVEIAVICQHAPAEDFYIVHFHGNHRGQLGKGVIVAITGRNLEGKRASLAHLQCQLGREQG